MLSQNSVDWEFQRRTTASAVRYFIGVKGVSDQIVIKSKVSSQETKMAIQAENTARSAMIAEAAYYRAERRGFESSHEIEDWLAAESEIDGMLRKPAPPVKRNLI